MENMSDIKNKKKKKLEKSIGECGELIYFLLNKKKEIKQP